MSEPLDEAFKLLRVARQEVWRARNPRRWNEQQRKLAEKEALKTERETATDRYIRAVVDAAPPLTPDQIARLRILIRGGRK